MKKKINKKGFTLVELLAVVVLLLAISVIAISSISAAMERTNKKQEDATKKLIVSYAEMYFDENKNKLGANPCVDVETLVERYSLDWNTLVDSDNNKFTGSVNKNKEYINDNCE